MPKVYSGERENWEKEGEEKASKWTPIQQRERKKKQRKLCKRNNQNVLTKRNIAEFGRGGKQMEFNEFLVGNFLISRLNRAREKARAHLKS